MRRQKGNHFGSGMCTCVLRVGIHLELQISKVLRYVSVKVRIGIYQSSISNYQLSSLKTWAAANVLLFIPPS